MSLSSAAAPSQQTRARMCISLASRAVFRSCTASIPLRTPHTLAHACIVCVACREGVWVWVGVGVWVWVWVWVLPAVLSDRPREHSHTPPTHPTHPTHTTSPTGTAQTPPTGRTLQEGTPRARPCPPP
mmetsp:Transcript_23212/g.52046  ORF Transcript_23212/g.52046 Transcript_23212/m.52046 type:complete len:128 (+) Transcript_23212:86-469(+)